MDYPEKIVIPEKMDKAEYVWYASYGSNMLRERFLVYITGGQFEGNQKDYSGCKDRTMPLEECPLIIRHDLYFAKQSGSWDGGGVCFVRNERSETSMTYGNMYLISKAQFLDLIKQENGDKKTEITIDFQQTVDNGSKVVSEGSWYGKVIYLGHKDSHPIFTITHQMNYREFNTPSKPYLSTIIRGLAKVHNMTSRDIISYLSIRDGIRGKEREEQLEQLVNEVLKKRMSDI